MSVNNAFYSDEPAVINLLDNSTYPFHAEKPSFIRARRYTYHFTAPGSKAAESGKWWTRKFTDEFFPAVDRKELLNIMTALNILDPAGRNYVDKYTNTRLARVLNSLRRLMLDLGAEVVVWTVCLVTLGPMMLVLIKMRYGK